MMSNPISPCISVCKTDPETGYCYGCGRTNEEKVIWKNENTSIEWKNENLEIIASSPNINEKMLEKLGKF